MIIDYRIVQSTSRLIARAAEGAVDALKDGRVEQEPNFTDRMLGRIEQAIDNYELNGVTWKAKTLTDRSHAAQESIYGADFMGVLDISLEGYKIKKGFLAQAKLLEIKGRMTRQNYEKMQEQCELMLSITPDSFVFMYSKSRIRIIPANSILNYDYRKRENGCRSSPYDLYFKSVTRFFEDHFQSFIGDRRICAPEIETLEEIKNFFKSNELGKLAMEWKTRNLIFIGARGVEK